MENAKIAVYFIIQESWISYGQEPKRFLKIGHSKNPKKRVYSFCGEMQGLRAKIIHTIWVNNKSLALQMERGYIRILKDSLDGKTLYFDSREWFPWNSITEQLVKNWIQ